jgi:hypothetical protein
MLLRLDLAAMARRGVSRYCDHATATVTGEHGGVPHLMINRKYAGKARRPTLYVSRLSAQSPWDGPAANKGCNRKLLLRRRCVIFDLRSRAAGKL